MNRDDIIRIAREAGAGEPDSLYGRTDYVAMTKYELERFAALVSAAEREACAQVCEELHASNYGVNGIGCAVIIRARGDK